MPVQACCKRASSHTGQAPARPATASSRPLANTPCLAPQDLLQRGLLREAAAARDTHSLAWVLATAKEFCVAVAYLHSMDVCHGDLKSSNVLLKAAAATAWDTRGFVAKVCVCVQWLGTGGCSVCLGRRLLSGPPPMPTHCPCRICCAHRCLTLA